jgi:hypothetical protein
MSVVLQDCYSLPLQFPICEYQLCRVGVGYGLVHVLLSIEITVNYCRTSRSISSRVTWRTSRPLTM